MAVIKFQIKNKNIIWKGFINLISYMEGEMQATRGVVMIVILVQSSVHIPARKYK